jgi:multidrug efflux pump
MIEVAHSVDGVDMVADLSGFSALQQVNTPNLTVAYVILKPFDERRRSAAEINAELNAKFANIQGGFTYALMPPFRVSATARVIRFIWKIELGSGMVLYRVR